MKAADISCAILAGGRSTRFGGVSKAYAIVGGRRIIDRITGVAAGIFQEVIIVTNDIKGFSDFQRFKFVCDLYAGAGPVAGIHAALSISEAESVFVVAADMPFIDAEIVQMQIDFFRAQAEADTVIPETSDGKEPLHGIYRRSVLPVLEEMLQRKPGFPVLALLDHINSVCFQPALSEKVKISFFNINTPADLVKAEEIAVRYRL